MKLTDHFTFEELTHSDIGARNGWLNIPNEQEKQNLIRLAEFLETVKIALGNKPVMINSAFRSKQINDAVGSKDTSQHKLGCAADIRVPGMSPKEVIETCIAAGLLYDQIILEFNSWVHISVPNNASLIPRQQALIIDKTGTRPFA